MIPVDTSIRGDHLRRGRARLVESLAGGVVACHPCVIEELACGLMRQRARAPSLLQELPHPSVATPSEVLALLEAHRLMGRGLGLVDASLLASALRDGVKPRTHEGRVQAAAREPGVGP